MGITSTSITLRVAQAHDRAVAVILGDLLDGEVEILVARDGFGQFGGAFFGGGSGGFGGHRVGNKEGSRWDGARESFMGKKNPRTGVNRSAGRERRRGAFVANFS